MATKLPWVELFTTEDGSLHIVKCRICIKVEKKDILFAHKWDFFYEYAHYKKANRIMGFKCEKKWIGSMSVSMPRTFLVAKELLVFNWHIGTTIEN
jgi:hypothetical protein